MQTALNFEIIEYTDPRWLDFIVRQPGACSFHHPAWMRVLASSYHCRPFVAAVFDTAGQMTAGLPVMEAPSLSFSHRWVSLPFTDHCTPLYSDPQAQRLLERSLAREAAHHGAGLELRWEFSAAEFHHISQHVLTLLPLYSDPARVAGKIKSNDLRKLRAAERRGVQIEMGTSSEQLSDFYRLHVETRRRLGVPVQPWDFFRRLREEMLAPGLGFISLARLDQQAVSGILFLHWNQTLIYKFAASNALGRETYASDPLVWEAIQWGSQRGYKVLDFGRSDLPDEGLRRFKKRWGADEIPLIYSHDREPGIGGLKNRLMPALHAVLPKAPLWVGRLIGELFYRYSG